MKRQVLYICVFALFLSSCKGTRNVPTGTSAVDMPLKDIINAHHEATPNFNTLAARVHVAYEDEKKSQSITVSLRMEKDRTIWVKASLLGITLAKALITPERVSYYEKISGTYFDGDFALLSEWLGTELDFEKAQAILLGQSIFSINKQDYSAAVVQNKYRILPKQQPHNFIHTLLLNPGDFKVSQGTLSQPTDGRMLSIHYGDYQQLEGSYYPRDISINSTEQDSKTKIEVNYRKIDLNVLVSFPFTIPSGYEEIQL